MAIVWDCGRRFSKDSLRVSRLGVLEKKPCQLPYRVAGVQGPQEINTARLSDEHLTSVFHPLLPTLFPLLLPKRVSPVSLLVVSCRSPNPQ